VASALDDFGSESSTSLIGGFGAITHIITEIIKVD
jgi:hypothetical protein